VELTEIVKKTFPGRAARGDFRRPVPRPGGLALQNTNERQLAAGC